MSKTWINFLLDAALLGCLAANLWIAAVIHVAFPPATIADGWRLWGWSCDQWLRVQLIAIGLFALGALLHVMLHWTWVCGVITSRLFRDPSGKKRQLDDGQRTLLGVGLLAALLGILGVGLAAAVLTVQSPAI